MTAWTCPTHGATVRPLVIGRDPYCPRSGCGGVLGGPRIPEGPLDLTPRKAVFYAPAAAVESRETDEGEDETEEPRREPRRPARETNDTEEETMAGASLIRVVLGALEDGPKTGAQLREAAESARPDLVATGRVNANLGATISSLRKQGRIVGRDGEYRLPTVDDAEAPAAPQDDAQPAAANEEAPKPRKRAPRKARAVEPVEEPADEGPAPLPAETTAAHGAETVSLELDCGDVVVQVASFPRRCKPADQQRLLRIADAVDAARAGS